MDFMPYNPQEMLVTYVKYYPGRFEKLDAVRKAMKLENGNKIVLSYNSQHYGSKKIIITVIAPLGNEQECVKNFMHIANSCEEMFRMKMKNKPIPTNVKEQKWGKLFTKPHMNTSAINTISELTAHLPPEHNVYFL
jgi:hypothetical protein